MNEADYTAQLLSAIETVKRLKRVVVCHPWDAEAALDVCDGLPHVEVWVNRLAAPGTFVVIRPCELGIDWP